MSKRDLPLTLTIATPSYIPRARGIHSTGRFGHHVKARITAQDRILIERAASELNITMAQFVRWSATHAANALLKELKDGEDDDA